jgi:hypothetical protein
MLKAASVVPSPQAPLVDGRFDWYAKAIGFQAGVSQ